MFELVFQGTITALVVYLLWSHRKGKSSPKKPNPTDPEHPT
jgi:hypothetical protein